MKTYDKDCKRYGFVAVAFRPVFLALLLSTATTRAQVPVSRASNERISEAIRLERTIKRRYLELIRIMHDVAKELAKADPDTAATVEEAAQKAEEALIAEDMDRVVQLLQSGLVLPADATQVRIIERLRAVLKALQGGDELEWALFMTEMIREQRARLAVLIGKQRELERHSRAVFKGGDMLAELDALRPQVAPLQEQQERLLTDTRDMPQSMISVNLGAVRGQIGEVVSRILEARKQLASSYPSPDEMVNNAATARAIHRAAIEARTGVRTVINQPDVDEFLVREKVKLLAPKLMGHLDAIVSELEIAARAYADDDLDAALIAVAECEHRLSEAGDAFTQIADADPQARALRQIFVAQEDLGRKFAEIRSVVEKTVPSDLSSSLPSSRLVDYDLGRSSIDTKAEDPALAYQAGVSAAIAKAIREHDIPGAVSQQEQMLNVLGDMMGRIDDATSDTREWHTSPRFPIQQRDQQGIADELRYIIERYASLTEAAGGEDAPLAMTGELRASMEGAADLASKATALLGEEKAEPANTAQNETIRLMTKVLEDMENLNTGDISGFIEEFLEYWNALLERLLLKQKMCIEETKNVWKKRPPKGADQPYHRAQQLQMRTIARTQKGMKADVWKMRQALNALALTDSMSTAEAMNAPMPVTRYGASEGQSLTQRSVVFQNGRPAVFGMFIALIEIELEQVVNLLEAFDPGLDTQKRQELIKNHLEAMIGIGAEEDNEPNASQDMASNDFMVGPKEPDESRKAIMRLMIALQEQINYRTQQLEEIKRTGKWTEELDKEGERLDEMQTMVHGNILRFAIDDATWWNLAGQGRGIGRGGL